MSTAIKNKLPSSPFKWEFKTAVVISFAFHAVLAALIIFAPKLWWGPKAISIPRSYTVDLVALPPELLAKLTVKPGALTPPGLPTKGTKGAASLKITPPKTKAESKVPLQFTKEKAPAWESKPEPLSPPTVAKLQGGDFPAWSSVGAMAVDADSFAFAYYLGAIQSKISGNWSPPSKMLKAGESERATVYFKILRNGQIKDLTIETSSGIFFFDQSTLRAVNRSVPLPPLPVGFGDETLGIHFDFELKGEG